MSQEEVPDDAVKIRRMYCLLPDECYICGKEFEFGGWASDLHGDAKCVHCDAPTQIRPLSDEDWDDVPRSNIADEFIEPLQEFVEETGSRVSSQDVNVWLENNYPELVS